MKIGIHQRLYNAEIRNRRLALGLTQGQLAKKLGVTAAQVNHIECLRILRADNPTIRKMAEVYGCKPEELCPDWLQLLETIPKRRRIEQTMTPESLESLDAKVNALPAPDVSGANYEAWLSEATEEHLTEDQNKILTLFLNMKETSLRSRHEELGRQFGVTSAATRSTLSRIKHILADAWRLHRKEEEV